VLKFVGKIAVLAMVALAICNAQCLALCAAGLYPWNAADHPDPPCHQHQPAHEHCAHPTPAFADSVSSAGPSPELRVIAIAGKTVDPIGAPPAIVATAILTEVWSPPSADRHSITILRI
jgi:hypothetical protein